MKNTKDFLTRSIEDKCGFNQYLDIINIKGKAVSNDKVYKKEFVNYYKIRRDLHWLDLFFDYMEKHKKDQKITFDDILDDISAFPRKVNKSKNHPNGISNNTVEASFASKMLNTIYPDKYPVLDKNVLYTIEKKIKYSKDLEEYKENAKKTYRELCDEVNKLKNNKSFFSKYEKMFDAQFPDFKSFSKIKKLDFYLWCLGEKGEFIKDYI